MFIDQEEKDQPVRRWMRRLLKLTFILSAIFLVFITILANMGGSSPMLKESAEKFIGEIFGNKAAVMQNLVRLSFFPMVGVDGEKLQVTEANAAGEAMPSEVVAVISKFRFFMDFWDMTFRNPRFRSFLIEDGFFRKGTVGNKALTIERAYIDPGLEPNTAKIMANGLYDRAEWSFSFGLEQFGSASRPEYGIAERSALSLKIADLRFSGTLVKSSDNQMKIEGFSLSQGTTTISGDAYFSMISDSAVKLRADIKLPGPEVKALSLDLIFNTQAAPLSASGKVTGQNFAWSDFLGDSSLRSVLSRGMVLFFDDPAIDNRRDGLRWWLNTYNFDVTFDFKNIALSPSHTANWTMRARQKGGVLGLEEIKGDINGAPVDVPALSVFQTQTKDETGFALLLYAHKFAPSLSTVLLEEKQEIKGLSARENTCLGGRLFSANPSHALENLSVETKNPYTISVGDDAFLRALFESPEAQSCLSFVAAKSAASPAPATP